MNRSLYALLLILFVSSNVLAQKKVKSSSGEMITLEKHGIICYESDEHFHGYSPAPANKNYGAKGNMPPANFQVSYKDFPAAHQAAIDQALAILSGMVNSPITIHVDAVFEEIPSPGALAGAFFNTSFYDEMDPDFIPNVNRQFNFTNTTAFNTFYPIALIEKLTGVEQTGVLEPDISIRVNSEANWFTDFQNPGNILTGQTDLVTIILHEVMHGMGFAGFSLIDDDGAAFNRLFTLTDDGTPLAFIYDRFVENGSGTELGLLENNSNELVTYLQSNDLFFNGPSLDAPAKLYAPSEFNRGSSLYHLDQTTYSNTDDRLMAPFYSSPDINHNPALGMEILYDMGWDYTDIDHTPLGFSEDLNLSYSPTVTISSDSGIDTTSLELVYSQDTFKTTTTLPMFFNASTSEFEATLPSTGEATTYQYYFQVTDKRGANRSTPPSYGALAHFIMTYGTDNTDPVIEHVPVPELTTLNNSILITASGSDFFAGIDNMFLEVTLNGGSLGEIVLNEEVDGFGSFQYDGSVNFGRNLLESDVITYKLRAVDKSLAANESSFPIDGSFISVPVIESLPVQDSYEASFDDNTISDFNLNGFGIELPNNFTDSCLANVMHPYPTAGASSTLNLTAELRVPIKVNGTDPSLIFDEIALIEPGEPNVPFGETNFYDYVIVEGRKLGSSQWVPFAPGYDATESNNWTSLYNNGSNPFQTSYIERELDITANTSFVDGDTIFVRFRLFSDPGAAGWGWAINNLKIQDRNSTVSVEEVENLEYFAVYPNPSRNQSEVILDMKFKEYQSDLQFTIHDTNGRLIRNWTTNISGRTNSESVDVSGMTKGVYFISARNSEEVTVRKLLIY